MKSRLLVTFVLAVILSTLMLSTASAALPANMSWVKYASNPVVTTSTCSGPTEAFRPAIVLESANNYKMYYSGRSDSDRPYLATTTNGGTTWTCGGGPLLALGGAGAWDEKRIITVSVIKDGSTYKMWYAGRDANANWAIGYATSSDGVAWSKYNGNGGPVLQKGGAGAWDSLHVREPSVVKVGTTYHMFYSGTAQWPYYRIGHATSSDGISWTKDPANPVVAPSAGKWDAIETYSPSVVMNGSVFEMFYSGNNGNQWLTGHASSNDGTTWTKDDNAILSPSNTGWEAGGDSQDYVGAVLDGTTWKIFYSQGGSYRIGMATLMNQAQLTFNQLAPFVTVGQQVVVKIDLTAVTDLYGYQFKVLYDSSKVSASGAFVNGLFDTSTNAYKAWNADCSTPGVCKFAVTKQGPTTPSVSGSGTIAQITFTGNATGLVPLTFDADILAKKDSTPIVHTANVGYLTVGGAPTAISGVVLMQGRDAAHSDAGSVTIYEQNGLYPPQTVTFAAGTGVWNAMVASDGTYDIVASHSLYLSNIKTGISFGAQPTTTLLGGDANNSGKVELGDLTCIGGDFGGAPGTCGGLGSPDINADNIVNILDLVLAGGNYDLTSPQPW